MAERNASNTDDPIRRRIERIIKLKRDDNARAAGIIAKRAELWKDLTKHIDDEISSAFEFMTTDTKAIDNTKELLKGPDLRPREDTFVLGGKIIAKTKKVGLPGLRLVMLRVTAEGDKELAETTTDTFGNFGAAFSADVIKELAGKTTRARLDVFADDPVKPVLTQGMSLRVQPGEIKDLKKLVVVEDGRIQKRIDAGNAAVDSVAKSADLVRRRLENMKGAHTAVTRLGELTLNGLKGLAAELSVAAPEPTIVVGELEEPPAPRETRKKASKKTKKSAKKVSKKKRGKKKGTKK